MLLLAPRGAGSQTDAVPGICLPVALWDVSAAPWGPGSLLPSVEGAGLS